MFNRVSYLLSSAREITGQLPLVLGGVGEEPVGEQLSVEPEQQKPVVLAWAPLPSIQMCGSLVPKGVVHLFFRKLNPKDIFNVRMVCRLWYQMAEQYLRLPKLFPDAPVLNMPVWESHIDLEKHGLVFEAGKEPPPLTIREYFETEHMAAEVEGGERITVLTLPKGLSMNKIIAFAGAPKMGNSTRVHIWNPRIIELYGDQEIKETITVVVTNGVFNNSRNIDVAAQGVLVKGLKCEMFELVPFMAHIILSFIRSDADDPQRLFGPGTYTRLFEDVDNFKAVGGGFASAGPLVAHDCNNVNEDRGVGGLRKFPAIGH